MGKHDPVDNTSLIFTEADIYMICGYLAEEWGVTRKFNITKHTEKAIKAVLEETNKA